MNAPRPSLSFVIGAALIFAVAALELMLLGLVYAPSATQVIR